MAAQWRINSSGLRVAGIVDSAVSGKTTSWGQGKQAYLHMTAV
jgi:hypothetical protein